MKSCLEIIKLESFLKNKPQIYRDSILPFIVSSYD